MTTFLQPLINLLLAQTPGEAQAAWPKGPTPIGLRATKQETVAQYIAWIVEVERALPECSPNEIIRRIRRMHYSNPFSLKPESGTSQNIDDLIGTTADNFDSDPPLTTDEVPITVLNGLYSVSSVRTPGGHSVDITHALNVIDLAVNGRSSYGGFAELGTFVLPNYETASADLVFATLGWLGDLISIWFQWMDKRGSLKDQPATLTGAQRLSFESAILDRCTLDDLLGDIDGAVMATIPSLASDPLSYTLTAYYSGEASPASLTAGFPTSRQRFHYFVDRSIPEFTSSRLSGAALRVSLSPATTSTVLEFMKRAIDIVYHRLNSIAIDDPATHDPIFLEITNRFLKWTQDGLADANGGVPPWPNAPTSVPS